MRLAHKFAIENDHITADMVEAIEFPHLANKYSVYGVPRTVINDTVHQEGAVPEPLMLAKLLEAVDKGAPPAQARSQEQQLQERVVSDQELDEEEWDDDEEWEEDEEWDEEDEEWDEEDDWDDKEDEEWDDED